MLNMVSWWSRYDGKPVLCAVHTQRQPKVEEWDEYLGHVRDLLAVYPNFAGAVGIAVTDGGAPNFAQRKRLVDIKEIVKPTTAVVSYSRFVRVAVGALAMFGYHIRVFGPERLSEACDHLGVPPNGRQALLEDIQKAALRLDRCTTAVALKLRRASTADGDAA